MRALQRAVRVSGQGLHTGAKVCVQLVPTTSRAVEFVRVDVHPRVAVAASAAAVVNTRLCTQLGRGADPIVSTVEHLMAALDGMGIVGCRVELDGPELPILDGSAAPWVQALEAEGAPSDVACAHPALRIRAPVRVTAGDAWISAEPSDRLRFSYSISFPDAAIGAQSFDWEPPLSPSERRAEFASELAPARTFTTAAQFRALTAAGLGRGGSLESAIVCDGAEWLNPPLRFANEPVRHKLLDLLGDLALGGRALELMHVRAHKAGHELHVRFLRELLAHAEAGPD